MMTPEEKQAMEERNDLVAKIFFVYTTVAFAFALCMFYFVCFYSPNHLRQCMIFVRKIQRCVLRMFRVLMGRQVVETNGQNEQEPEDEDRIEMREMRAQITNKDLDDTVNEELKNAQESSSRYSANKKKAVKVVLVGGKCQSVLYTEPVNSKTAYGKVQREENVASSKSNNSNANLITKATGEIEMKKCVKNDEIKADDETSCEDIEPDKKETKKRADNEETKEREPFLKDIHKTE